MAPDGNPLRFAVRVVDSDPTLRRDALLKQIEREMVLGRMGWMAIPLDIMTITIGSVGRAMAYTTIVITLGFSILALSNFVPTVYFGLFTGAAMLIALVSNLTLLPLLLRSIRPFALPQAA